MEKNPHYFIGIPLSPDLQAWLMEYQRTLAQFDFLAYKQWTNPNDLHITLKFLGAVDNESINSLIQKLSKLNIQSFALEVGGAGTFGNPNKPRVLWAGVKKTDRLETLYKEIESVCSSEGFPKENRPYRPHITLAKKWNSNQLTTEQQNFVIHAISERKELLVNHFVVYQINPQQVPKYKIVKRINLN